MIAIVGEEINSSIFSTVHKPGVTDTDKSSHFDN